MRLWCVRHIALYFNINIRINAYIHMMGKCSGGESAFRLRRTHVYINIYIYSYIYVPGRMQFAFGGKLSWVTESPMYNIEALKLFCICKVKELLIWFVRKQHQKYNRQLILIFGSFSLLLMICKAGQVNEIHYY